jgi:general secretion pathway protein M
MPAVTDRDRWLALGLLLAVVAMAYLVLLHPWWTVPMRETDARIQVLQQREMRARMRVQQAPGVANRLREAMALEAQAPVFLPEANPELATAGLVQRLETEVARVSPGNRACAINNRDPLPAIAGDARFPRVAVHVRLRCGNPELVALLHALEGGNPRLFVDNLGIVSSGFFQAATGGVEASSGLDVEFDLHGFLKPASVRQPVEVHRAP